MIKRNININTIDKVKDFVNKTSKIDGDVELTLLSNRYIVDARSIMGIFSLDLSKNIVLQINGITSEQEKLVIPLLKDFFVKS